MLVILCLEAHYFHFISDFISTDQLWPTTVGCWGEVNYRSVLKKKPISKNRLKIRDLFGISWDLMTHRSTGQAICLCSLPGKSSFFFFFNKQNVLEILPILVPWEVGLFNFAFFFYLPFHCIYLFILFIYLPLPQNQHHITF